MNGLRRVAAAVLGPSPFKVGLLIAVLSVTLHPRAPLHWTPRPVTEFVHAVDDRARDAMFKMRGPDPRPRHELSVVVVDIDEPSLAELGQWPWPRDVVAKLLREVDACEPRAIGLDIVFAEPDRSSLKYALPRINGLVGGGVPVPDDLDMARVDELLDAFRAALGPKVDPEAPAVRYLDHDAVLAAFVEDCPRVVLGYFWQLEDDGLFDEFDVPYGAGVFVARGGEQAIEDSPFQKLGVVPYRPILNIPVLADAAMERSGSFNPSTMLAGTIRRVPLVWEFQDNLYPSLPLQMLRLALGGERASGTVEMDELGVTGIRIPVNTRSTDPGHGSSGELYVPTDEIGRMYVNFRGPARTFDYIPAADMLQGDVSPERIRGKHVLLGSSAGGLLDLRSTPFDEGCPGVEVHANVADNILEGDMLREPAWAWSAELVFILVAGIVTALVGAYARPLLGAVFLVAMFVGIVLLGYHLMFEEHLVLTISFPIVSVLAVFVTVTVLNYFFEGRKKRFIQGAFSTYLSPALVEQLVADPDRLSLKGEQKELTILFSDIRSFTSISEKMTAEELATFLNEYLTPMADIVMQTRGTVDKFVGDEIMAFWNAPLDDPDHAANAARAALRMMETLHAMQGDWDARGLPTVRIGIGLNTGQMSVGNMGSDTRFDYTVMGDNVNLGSRLEGATKEYKVDIILSESTRAALSDRFFCRLLDKVRVKGKEEPSAIYELICEGPPSDEVRAEVAAFEAAFADYQARRFDQAREKILVLRERRPARLYDVYLERIETFLREPPGPDWDGVTTFTTK